MDNPYVMYGMLGAMVLGVIFLIFMRSRKVKAAQFEYTGMLDTLRPGMRVKTVGGVIGRIREIREEAPGFKTVLLETGDMQNPSLVLYDLQAIYGVVDEEGIQRALAEKQETIQEHKAPDTVINESQNSFEPKKTKPKSGKA